MFDVLAMALFQAQTAPPPRINYIQWIAPTVAKLTVETDINIVCVAFDGEKRAGSGSGYPTGGVVDVLLSIPAGVKASAVRFECAPAPKV